jgi:tryptophan synthase alpha chain
VLNRIDKVFKQHNRKALIAYITAGIPNVSKTIEIVPRLASLGCDIIELGIPFSDPLADGVTIQEASFKALRNGFTLETCLEMTSIIRHRTDVPIVYMSYCNPILSFGIERFSNECRKSGVDGIIVPDLPPDEAIEIQDIMNEQGIHCIYLLAPNSPRERIALVEKKSNGFIYLVSLTGVTGTRKSLPANLESYVMEVREQTTKPLCVGFGISTPEQGRSVARVADGVIIGSKFVQLIGDNSIDKLTQFTISMRQALDNPGL